jgi:hypothetical protein
MLQRNPEQSGAYFFNNPNPNEDATKICIASLEDYWKEIIVGDK